MKKNLTKMMLIALLAIFPLSIFAQSAYQKKYFYMGVEGGLSVYHGDLSNYKVWWKNIKDFNTRHLAFDGKLTLGYQFGGVVGMNLKLGYVGLTGEKADVASYLADPRTKWITVGAPKDADYGEAGPEELGYNTYEFMKTHSLDASLNATFDLCNLIGGYKYDRVFHFVPHVGVGALMFTPQAVNGYNFNFEEGHPYKITPDDGEGAEAIEAAGKGMFGKPQVTLTLPVGAEMYFRLHRVVDLFVDYTYNFTFTDKIDRMTKGADEKFLYNDKWGTVNLGLRFKFVKRVADIERMAKEAGQITYTVTPDPLEEHDGKIECDVEVKVPAKYFEKEATMTFTPYVNYNGKQIELDPITFIGEKVKDIPGTQVSYKNGGTFTFHNTFDYDFSDDEGMKNATISGTPIFTDVVNEGHTAQGAEQVIYKGGIVRTTPYEFNLSACTPENGTITLSEQGEVTAGTIITVTATPANGSTLKSLYYTVNGNTTTITGNTFTMPEGNTVVCAEFKVIEKPFGELRFEKNKYDFKEKLFGNKEALNNIVKEIKENNITSITLDGWASPEGDEGRNEELSNNRAKAIEKAINNRLKKEKIKNVTVTTKQNGPDKGAKFVELLSNSNFKDKDAILNVIKLGNSCEALIDTYSNDTDFEKEVLSPLRRVEFWKK